MELLLYDIIQIIIKYEILVISSLLSIKLYYREHEIIVEMASPRLRVYHASDLGGGRHHLDTISLAEGAPSLRAPPV